MFTVLKNSNRKKYLDLNLLLLFTIAIMQAVSYVKRGLLTSLLCKIIYMCFPLKILCVFFFFFFFFLKLRGMDTLAGETTLTNWALLLKASLA